jgi:hypothetical protein
VQPRGQPRFDRLRPLRARAEPARRPPDPDEQKRHDRQRHQRELRVDAHKDAEHHHERRGGEDQRHHAAHQQLVQERRVGLQAVRGLADRHPRVVSKAERLQVEEQALAQVARQLMAGARVDARMRHEHRLVRGLDHDAGEDGEDQQALAAGT